MALSFLNLWILLIDKEIKKCDMERGAGITHYALGQLTRGKDVSMEVLGEICQTSNCKNTEIMEYIPDREGDDI